MAKQHFGKLNGTASSRTSSLLSVSLYHNANKAGKVVDKNGYTPQAIM